MNNISITIDGDLEARLRSLGPELARRALREAIAAGGAVLADAVKERVPVRTGLLRESVETGVEISSQGNSGIASVAFGIEEGKIASLVEFGHHEVTRSHLDAGNVPAHPFLRPAFDESAIHAAEAAISVLVGSIPKA